VVRGAWLYQAIVAARMPIVSGFFIRQLANFSAIVTRLFVMRQCNIMSGAVVKDMQCLNLEIPSIIIVVIILV
jgi:hypothetical protein